MRAQFVLHYFAFSIFPSVELDSSAFRDAVYGLWPLLLVHFLSCRSNLSGTSEARLFIRGPKAWHSPTVITVGAAKSEIIKLWIQRFYDRRTLLSLIAAGAPACNAGRARTKARRARSSLMAFANYWCQS